MQPRGTLKRRAYTPLRPYARIARRRHKTRFRIAASAAVSVCVVIVVTLVHLRAGSGLTLTKNPSFVIPVAPVSGVRTFNLASRATSRWLLQASRSLQDAGALGLPHAGGALATAQAKSNQKNESHPTTGLTQSSRFAAFSHNHPIIIQSVLYETGVSRILVRGRFSVTYRSRECWVQIEHYGRTANVCWQYPVPAHPGQPFAALLSLPFGPGTYQVAAAPSLTTAQTSLLYRFATRQQTQSETFTIADVQSYSNQQMGQLTSVWANWTNPATARLAKVITAGLKTPLEDAQAIYRYEADHISYDGYLLQKGEYGWSTAQETLTSGAGICVDYANVADALLRALHIPAQMVVGYAHDDQGGVADNDNMGHAWNRAWIDHRWIYFDPTWSREYFLPFTPAPSLPNASDLYLYQPQWFNPPPKLLESTHVMSGIEYQ